LIRDKILCSSGRCAYTRLVIYARASPELDEQRNPLSAHSQFSIKCHPEEIPPGGAVCLLVVLPGVKSECANNIIAGSYQLTSMPPRRIVYPSYSSLICVMYMHKSTVFVKQKLAERKKRQKWYLSGWHEGFWVDLLPVDPQVPQARPKALVICTMPGNRPVPFSTTKYSARPPRPGKKSNESDGVQDN
jgi:hypothetical protein